MVIDPIDEILNVALAIELAYQLFWPAKLIGVIAFSCRDLWQSVL
jgi:hypothetical protein